MTNKIVVLSTCASLEEADRLARSLVEQRLAACVNVIPGISSHYWWQGKLETAQAFKHTIVFEKGTKRLYAKDLGRQAVKLRPNQQFEVWAKFSLPQNRSENAICLHVQGTPLIENVPIQATENRKGSN